MVLNNQLVYGDRPIVRRNEDHLTELHVDRHHEVFSCRVELRDVESTEDVERLAGHPAGSVLRFILRWHLEQQNADIAQMASVRSRDGHRLSELERGCLELEVEAGPSRLAIHRRTSLLAGESRW